MAGAPDPAAPPVLMRLEACVIAVSVRVALRVMPLPRLVRALAALPGVRADPVQDADACRRAGAAAVARVAHPTCLFEALTTFGLLARRGHAAVFHVGGARDAGFQAHAWVSVDGRPLDGSTAGYSGIWHFAAESRTR